MTLVDDMRPGASPHIGLCRNGKSKVQLALPCMRTGHLIYVGVVAVARHVNL